MDKINTLSKKLLKEKKSDSLINSVKSGST